MSRYVKKELYKAFAGCAGIVDEYYPQALFISYPQIIIWLFNPLILGSRPANHD